MSLKKIANVIKEYRDFPLFNGPSSLIDIVSNQIPVFLLAQYATANDVGSYSYAQRILYIPVTLIGAAITQVFYQRFAESNRNNENTLPLLLKTWKPLCLISFIPLTLTFFWGEPIFSFVFGQQWAYAGRISSVLAPMLFFVFVSSPTSSSYLVLGLQKYGFVLCVYSLIYRFFTLSYGLHKHNVILGLRLYVLFEISQILLYNALLIYKIKKRNLTTCNS